MARVAACTRTRTIYRTSQVNIHLVSCMIANNKSDNFGDPGESTGNVSSGGNLHFFHAGKTEIVDVDVTVESIETTFGYAPS